MKKKYYGSAILLIGILVCSCFCVQGTANAQSAEPLPVEVALKVHRFAFFSFVQFSPDGNWLAYVVQDNQKASSFELKSWINRGVPGFYEGTDIYLVNAQSGQTRNLTANNRNNWLPRWSPDGHWLAFVSDRDASTEAKLWIWDTAKDQMRSISDRSLRADEIEWTADSRSILVTTFPQGLTRQQYLERTLGTAQPGRLTLGRTAGSTVLLYRSNAAGATPESVPESDPWNLEWKLRDLTLVDVASGETRDLISSKRINRCLLSPDDRRVACTVAKRFENPGQQQILYDVVVVTLATLEKNVVTSDIRLHYDGAQFSWSPDGLRLAYRAYGPAEQTFDCFVVGATGGTARNVTHFGFPPLAAGARQKPRWPLSGVPLWDARGDSIYLITGGALWRAVAGQDNARELARIPGHKIIRLIAQSREQLSSVDGGQSTIVVAESQDGAEQAFYRIELATGQNRQLQAKGQCYTCSNLNEWQSTAVSKDGKTVAYFAEDADHDTDLWVADSAFRNPWRLTHLNPQFDRYRMGAPRLIKWRSTDGEELQGVLLLPSNYEEGKSYPLIVWVYGGEQSAHHFDLFGLDGLGPGNMQLFAMRGYAVLWPDAPQHLATPMLDLVKTVMPGINKVIELGIADSQRLGIAGHSYGGYSTLALIVQSKRFKAAMESAGAGNLVGMFGEMNPDGTSYGGPILEHGQGLMGGPPWQFPQRYVENSPVFYLDRVETPLLIVQGANDRATGAFLQDEIFADLRRLGKEAEYAKYEGEDHLPLTWSYANQLDFCDRMIAWFDVHLKERK